MKHALPASTLATLAAFVSSQAMAHAHLSAASPSAGSTISSSPSQIRLTFTEGLQPAFSGVEVDGPDGAKIASDAPKISGKEMVVPVTKSLTPGEYHVKWHATAVDTHKTQGNFTFVVKP